MKVQLKALSWISRLCDVLLGLYNSFEQIIKSVVAAATDFDLFFVLRFAQRVPVGPKRSANH